MVIFADGSLLCLYIYTRIISCNQFLRRNYFRVVGVNVTRTYVGGGHVVITFSADDGNV